MKKYLTLLACTAFLGQAVQAEEYIGAQVLKGKTLQDASIMGSAQLTEIKADSLSILGTLEFHDLTVKKGTSVVGPIKKSEKGTFSALAVVGEFEATNVTCENLDVAGLLNVTGLTVSGNAVVAGPLTLKASTDPKVTPNKLKNLTVTAEEISLEDTSVEGNIVVKKSSGWFDGDKKQVLHLKGKTSVKGTITFDSGKGIIALGPDAKVEGKVTGATIEKK